MTGDGAVSVPRSAAETTEALAQAVYEANEWSGCNGSRWGALPAEAKFFRIDAAAAHLAALEAAGFVVIRPPTVAFKGPNETDASVYQGAADRLEFTAEVGGPTPRAAVVAVLRTVAAAVEARDD